MAEFKGEQLGADGEVQKREQAVSMLLEGKSVTLSHPGLYELDVVIKCDGTAVIMDKMAGKDSSYEKGTIGIVDDILEAYLMEKNKKEE